MVTLSTGGVPTQYPLVTLVDSEGSSLELSSIPAPKAIAGDGAVFGTIPGAVIGGTVSLMALSSGLVRYEPWVVDYECVLDELYTEITTAAAAGKLIRLGVYRANSNWQPTGAAVATTGNLAADPGVVPAIVSATGLGVTLSRGLYVAALSSDGAPTLRTVLASTRYPIFNRTANSNSNIIGLKAIQAFPSGGWPDPPAQWTGAQDSGTTAMRYAIRAVLL